MVDEVDGTHITPSAPVLALRDLSLAYGKTQVLDGLNLELAAGEIAVLLGRNGAGKSTLLRCAAGWMVPTKGSVELLGQPLRAANRRLRREAVLVTDTPPFYDDLTGEEHVSFVLRANRYDDRLSEGDRLLSVFGLTEAADAYPSTMSRGMRYKLALVLALALQPRLLLLDEPFGPIDAASALQLWSELQTLAGAGSAVLFAAHQLPDDVVAHTSYHLDGGVLSSATSAEVAG